MKQYLWMAVLTYVAFLGEFVLYNVFGPWGKPEFLLLWIIFSNLYWGVRHSLVAAVMGGLLKGAFDIEPSMTHVFLFVCAAYLTTFIRKTVYKPGSRFSRLVVAFLVLVSVFVVDLLLHVRLMDVRLLEALTHILFPSLVLTMLAATLVFAWLKSFLGWLKL